MAKHYLDFVGLNTFIYEPVGWDIDEQETEVVSWGLNLTLIQNYQGNLYSNVNTTHKNFKNFIFSDAQGIHLPTTASFFPALMLKRNGPYGHNSFKQIRISQNPLTRKQIKNNVFTFITEPGDEVVINNNGKISTIRNKYGAIQKFTENPVSSRYKPFVVGGGSIINNGTLERFEAVASYGNETIFFNNEGINKYHNLRVLRSNQYNTLKDFYLNGGLDADGSPIDSFEFLKYGECVYPPRIYQYKNYVRQRTTFSFPWRDDRENRSESTDNNDFGSPTSLSSFGEIQQSVWPLDATTDFSTTATAGSVFGNLGLTLHAGTSTAIDNGILQNQYNFGVNDFHTKLNFGGGATGIDNRVAIAPIYNRRHTITLSSSVVSPNGMNIEGINSGSTFGNLSTNQVGEGTAKWEAGSQSGLNPFYDTYDNYIQGVRQYGKDYSIIPEFRISEHVETYQSKGLSEEVSNLFSLTGALSDTTDSSKDNFYTIYSTSEFMKHFEVVKKDHKDFVPANSISLKCKAIKKFLPYEGFYPAQRSVDLAKQFFDSYSSFVAVSGASNAYGTSSASPYLFQNLMAPTFAPGIFFNTMKSGVAVDYPLIDSNVSLANGYVRVAGNNYSLKSSGSSEDNWWDRRIPFEALVEPEKHLAGFDIFCNEPHKFANNSGSVFWDGNGNNLYKLMAHNFLAETNDFFMKRKAFTSISSRPSSDPNVGRAEAGKKYIMRVKMYKSQDQSLIPSPSGSIITNFVRPQYDEGSRETFTMYSRPTAFGPSQDFSFSSSGLASAGRNYAFTPPYYYGQAFCDILFEPSQSKKFTIQEIISGSTIRQWRHTDFSDSDGVIRTLAINGQPGDLTNPDKELAMHLNASVNIFSQTDVVVEQVKGTRGGVVLPNSSDNPSRWVIQTKFETPMLNFNHLSASTSITLPQNASQSVPRGMWHQYGRIEEDPSKGIFLQVDDVPDNWITGFLNQNTSNYESLVDLCGFNTEAKRLGEIADQKKVYEAVVAVPFIEEDGDRKFFRIPRIDIQRAFSSAEDQALVGDSVFKMIAKMQRYIFPPPMDFINNETIDPFAMYVFEFSHTLKKQDLANIWQNLYPEIGQTFETAESSITHELLAHELLGGGAIVTPEGSLDINAVGNEIPDRVRWMVFKVKQRAETNYFKKIIERNDELLEASVDVGGANVNISYNWPYDFFSLVELAKIESEVKFAERAVKIGQEPRETVIAKTNDKISIGGGRSDLGSRSTGGLNEELERVRIQKVAKAKRAATRALGDGSRADTVSRNRQAIRDNQDQATVKEHRHQGQGVNVRHEHEVELDNDGTVKQHGNGTVREV